jgi:alcohol dehydrogenase class IV
VGADFTWRDGERLIRFGAGTAAEAPDLLASQGLGGYVLLTTERAAASAPLLAERARALLHVPPGRVDEISAALLPDLPELPLVALGGGRVVDTAKALAGAREVRCAALPTTLSGAEMTPFHRLPKGVEGARTVRPALVVADPALMASAPPPGLAASAMNALAHAMEALYTPLANPVTDMAALRAAELIAAGVERGGPDELALGALLAGYASGATGIAGHHALCQTIVRTAGTPHAETNAVMLPHFARLMTTRAPTALARFAVALGAPEGDPGAAAAALGAPEGDPVAPAAALGAPEDSPAARLAALAAHSGNTRLSELGVEQSQLSEIAATAARHPLLASTPDPPDADELVRLLREAL